MNPYLLASLSALLISLIGSLPLGSLNITAMYIGARKGIKAAVRFAIGVILIEILYLRASLVFIEWIISHKQLFNILQWGVVLLFIVLALHGFFGNEKDKNSEPVLQKNNPFILGILLSAVNPLQIPFWAGWAVYLTTSKVLIPENIYYNIFSMSAGIGTFLALLIFILSGARFSAYIKGNTRKVNIVMGIIFLLLAAYQTWSLCTKS